jgi:hypothetical protein
LYFIQRQKRKQLEISIDHLIRSVVKELVEFEWRKKFLVKPNSVSSTFSKLFTFFRSYDRQRDAKGLFVRMYLFYQLMACFYVAGLIVSSYLLI